MFNKLMQTVLSRTFFTLRCLRTSKSMTLCKRFNNYNHKLAITSNFSCLTQVKCKYKAGSSKTDRIKNTEEDLDDEEEENYDDLKETGKKILFVNAKSMRLDAVVKAGFGISRNKVETAFYNSKIHVNGKKVSKKSELVCEGDEIDLIHSSSPNNPDLLVVTRIIILNITDNGEVYKFKIARDKNLTIDAKAADDDD